MLKLILPLVMVSVGLSAGVFGGKFLRGDPSETEAPVPDKDVKKDTKEDAKKGAKKEKEAAAGSDKEYVKLSNQFVIPLVENGTVGALVVMALSVEVKAGQREIVFAHEPKIRDSFLQVMFDHANMGGFRGDFTRHENLGVLRRSLKDVAMRDLGEIVSDVLILEIARQDY